MKQIIRDNQKPCVKLSEYVRNKGEIVAFYFSPNNTIDVLVFCGDDLYNFYSLNSNEHYYSKPVPLTSMLNEITYNYSDVKILVFNSLQEFAQWIIDEGY